MAEADENKLNDWAIEEIPDKDILYYRIHKTYLSDNELIPGAFRDTGEGENRSMSTNWNRYSTPEDTKNEGRIPSDNGVIELNVKDVRDIPQKVIHSPNSDNRAHSSVLGKKDTKARLLFLDIYQWSIRI